MNYTTQMDAAKKRNHNKRDGNSCGKRDHEC